MKDKKGSLAKQQFLNLAILLLAFCWSGIVSAQLEFPPLPDNPDRVAGSNEAFGEPYEFASTTEVTFNVNFSAATPSPSTFATTEVQRDVRVQFFTRHGIEVGNTNRTLILVNGIQRAATSLSSSAAERSHVFILNRNFFNTGNNEVTFRAANRQENRIWGIRNIDIAYIEPITLQVGVQDNDSYGFNRFPSRFTSLRANFELSAVESDLGLDVLGFDMDRSDETQLFLNGQSIGFLTANSNRFNSGDTFILPVDQLVAGVNQLEFFQRYPSTNFSGPLSEDWAVSQLLLRPVNSDLRINAFNFVESRFSVTKPNQVSLEVENIGEIASSVGELSFVLSPDDQIDTDDAVLLTIELAELDTETTINLDQTLDISRSALDQFLGVCITAVENEQLTENNCSAGILLEADTTLAPIYLLLDE